MNDHEHVSFLYDLLGREKIRHDEEIIAKNEEIERLKKNLSEIRGCKVETLKYDGPFMGVKELMNNVR